MISCHDAVVVALVGLLAYLVGSLPTGLLVARGHGAHDRVLATRGPLGATHIALHAGPVAGGIALGLDLAKGAGAVWTGALAGGLVGAAISGALAVTGQVFPLWTGFRRGGRGVATTVGATLAFDPRVVLAVLVLWVVLTYALLPALRRGTSAAFAVIVLPPTAAVMGTPGAALLGLFVLPVSLFAHRERLRALLGQRIDVAGTETGRLVRAIRSRHGTW